MPTISVIIPTYNHRDFVVETLESVFAQTFTDYEVIVVNDGSRDDTSVVLRPYIHSGKIRYFEQPNSGQGSARNRGLLEARGEFVAFLDDDDLWPTDKLSWQVDVGRRHPSAVMIYGFAEVFGGEFPVKICPSFDAPTGDVFGRFLSHSWTCSPGQTLQRRDAVMELKGFDPTVSGADDWDLYLKLARLGPFHYEHRLALHYRVHAQNASGRVLSHYRNALKVRHRHMAVARELGLDLSQVQPASDLAAGFREQARRFRRAATNRGDWVAELRYLSVIPLINPMDHVCGTLRRLRARLSVR